MTGSGENPAGGNPAGSRPARTAERRERILTAAASLVAERGFHAVGMGDIGSAAGITGPAIYRHFQNKAAVLAALFDRVIDGLLVSADEVVGGAPDADTALRGLIEHHLDFAVSDRALLTIYLQEIHHLPAEDSRRLRRKQRIYLDSWEHAVGLLRPELVDEEVRTVVHASIGVLHSVVYYDGGLNTGRAAELLTAMAYAALNAPLPPATWAPATSAPATSAPVTPDPRESSGVTSYDPEGSASDAAEEADRAVEEVSEAGAERVDDVRG